MYMDAFHSLIRAIVRCTKPTIAQLEGAAVGFGADMALACDLRLASTTAYSGEVRQHRAHARRAAARLSPASHRDGPRDEGHLLSDKLEAKDLDALGLLTSVVAPEETEGGTRALAERIENGAPLATPP